MKFVLTIYYCLIWKHCPYQAIFNKLQCAIRFHTAKSIPTISCNHGAFNFMNASDVLSQLHWQWCHNITKTTGQFFIFTCLYISKPSEIPVIFISSISSQDIKALQSSQQRTENLRKKFIGSLILYSVVMYILAAFVCYFYDFPKSWKAKIVRSIPLLVFPFV